jgi:hypothetical protein
MKDLEKELGLDLSKLRAKQQAKRPMSHRVLGSIFYIGLFFFSAYYLGPSLALAAFGLVWANSIRLKLSKRIKTAYYDD